MKIIQSTFLFPILILCFGCQQEKNPENEINVLSASAKEPSTENSRKEPIIVGAAQIDTISKLLKGKRIALVMNHSSLVGKTLLVDTLVALNIDVKRIFTPEHGFRVDQDAGAKIENTIDKKTGLPIISLYGDHYKPSLKELAGIDIVVFDIQDVGVRFYTYISTMHFVMEACAESNIPFLVLDRPNPNGFYVDGPILEPAFKSITGMHPVPIVHGMTIGEYALMINGEKWLADSIQCDLHIIKCKGYDHNYLYTLPVNPSPNLPDMASIYLYPSLCLFEGSVMSVGRGTDHPFKVIGHPKYHDHSFSFTPKSKKGAKKPKYANIKCYGKDFSNFSISKFIDSPALDFKEISYFYENLTISQPFFNDYFNYLAGNETLKNQILAGETMENIRKSWQKGLKKYQKTRKQYLLYADYISIQKKVE